LAGELRQARLEAADVLRSVPTGIVTVDQAGHLLYCNPAAEQILGFKERQWRGRPIMPEFAKIAPEFWAAITATARRGVRAKRVNADEKFLTSLVVRETDRLSRLLSEFLDFSRVRATECRPLDLRTVAAAAIRLVREHPDCPEDAVIDLKGESTPMEGDEDLLHRVVSNLVLNAVQATGKGARVVVRT